MDYIAVSISIQPYDQDIADMLVAELGDIAANDFLRVIRSLEKRRQAA